MSKILLGIPALGNELIIDQEEDGSWTDFELFEWGCGYKMSFETMLGFDNKNGAREWLEHCLKAFTDYMVSHNYDTTRELDMYTVLTEGVDVNTEFSSVEDAYAFMKLIVNGFHGQGEFVTGEEKC